MKRPRAVQPVVAYVWLIDGREVQVRQSDFWPGCHINDGYALLDWSASPVFDIVDGFWRPRAPGEELLACGHVLPMRRRNKRGWYVRPGRRCALCAGCFG